MKKVLAVVLGLVMMFACTAVLTGCGGSEESSEPAGDAGMKVGLICLHDENSTYDLNFINDFKEACETLGITEENYMIKTNIAEGQECYDAAAELVDAGCTFVFADSYGHQDFTMQAAMDFPDVQFVNATGDKAPVAGVENYHSAFGEIFDARYLAGIAAGMKLNEMIDNGEIKASEAKLGYLGAKTYAEIISGYTAWFLGARSVCPDATMDVTFTGNWLDETAEKEAANRLIDNGCVLISQHADSMGAPTACEKAGVPNVSYNGSTIDACPNTFIVSSRIDWSPFFEYAIGAMQSGETFDTDWTGTMETGSVVLTDINEAVAAEGTAEAIEEAKAKLMADEIHVFDTSTFTVTVDEKDGLNASCKVDDEGHLTSAMANAEADDAFEPETEAVADGYYHESEFRSAPYFDVQIDGITLLDTSF